MKCISSYLIGLLFFAVFSPVVFSASEEQISSCENEAVEMGLQSGEEFDGYVADCLEQSESMSSEEEMSETLTEGSE